MGIFNETAYDGVPTDTVSIDEMKSILELQSFFIDKITAGDSLANILENLSTSLEEYFHRKMYCSILLLSRENTLTVGAAPNVPEGFIKAIHPLKVGPMAGSCGTAVYRNEPVITPDIVRDSLWGDLAEVAIRYDIQACWSIPIKSSDEILGSFAIYHTKICEPTAFELEILKTCANLAGFTIERDKRVRLEKQLIESEQRFKSLFDHFPEPIQILSLEGDFSGFNNKNESVFGYKQEELLGRNFLPCIISDNNAEVELYFKKAREQGTVQHIECQVYHKNGNELTVNLTFLPMVVKGKVAGIYVISRDITYEKQLEEELRVSHKEIDHILNNHQGMIFKFIKTDGQFIHTYGAGQLFERLGMPLHDFVGKSLYDILPVSEANRKVFHYQQAWEGKHSSYEANVNGIDYVATLQPIYEDGQVVEVIVSCSDITELKKTHDDLREMQELLESFVHNTVDAIATMDYEGNLTFVNKAYVDMFGSPEEELIGKKVQSIPEGYEEEFWGLVDMVYSGVEVKGFETYRKREDGSLIPVSVTHAPLKDKYGVINGFSAIIRDITKQKQIEQELEENKQRYQSLFYFNPDLVYSLDLNGVLTNINPSVQRLLGYTPEQIIGKRYTEYIEDQHFCHTKKSFQKSIQGIPQTFETGLNHKNNHPVIFHVTNIPIIVNGEIVGIYGIAKDVSELKRAEEFLRKSDRISAIGQLAAGIAHEIRNPLTSVKGFLQFMQEQSTDQDYFEIMRREIERIELITNEFLILAKPQAKSYSYISIESILSGFIPLVETQAKMSNIDIIMEIEENLPDIYCDGNQIKQVFLNVIKNAMESMPSGGQITFTIKKNEDHVQILIKDQGCGIPPERLKRIGEPFYSTKEKGTGLGLMIIFNLIKEHKGSIDIQSELNKGTQVEICLPLKPSN
ncbi:MAG: PAS domain S-box protein [Bacillota bacterium]